MFDKYPILKSKLDKRSWKLFHIMNYSNMVKRNIFKPSTNLLESIFKLHSIFVTETYYNNLKINEDAIYNYIGALDKLYNESDSEEYKNKVAVLQNMLLCFHDDYVIKGKFMPIITMNESQGRLFVNPIYNWKLNHIKNLFIKFGFIVPPKNKKCIYFDVNGLTVRGLCYYIYTVTKDINFKYLSNYKKDIYEHIYKISEVSNILYNKSYNRDKFKIGLIAYLFGKNDKFFDILYNNSILIRTIKNYANQLGHDLISQYSVLWLLYILYNCFLSLEKSYINVPFLNYDGGYIIISKNTYNKMSKNFSFLRLSEW